MIGGGDLDGDLRDAEKKKAAGFTAYKIKVGIDTAAERRRAHARDLQGARPRPADFGRRQPGLQRPTQAIDYVRAVEGCGLDFFEQPVEAADLAGMAAVAAAATDIAIGADEGIHSLADIKRHHERKAARGVSLKAIKLGGMRGVVEAGRLCDSLGMSVNISCKTGESSIACAAALHVACVIPNIAWALTLTHIALAEDVTAQPIATARGHVESARPPRPRHRGRRGSRAPPPRADRRPRGSLSVNGCHTAAWWVMMRRPTDKNDGRRENAMSRDQRQTWRRGMQR